MKGSQEDSGADPVETLANARDAIRKLKAENREILRRWDLLLNSNYKFAELVILMEKRVRELTEERSKTYKYSYGQGWIEKDSADPKKLNIVKPDVSVQEINSQLEEIMRLIKMHSTKNEYKGSSSNII